MEPSACERDLRGLRVLEVALHDAVAGHDDLSHGHSVSGDVHEVLLPRRRALDHTDRVGVDHGDTLAGLECGALVRVQFVPPRLRRAHREGSVRFGQSVHLRDLDTQVLEPTQNRR